VERFEADLIALEFSDDQTHEPPTQRQWLLAQPGERQADRLISALNRPICIQRGCQLVEIAFIRANEFGVAGECLA
jgi:hypothetical protein